MKVAVTNVVVFELPDGIDLDDARDKFLRANMMFIGVPMQTLTGLPYVILKVERFEVEQRE